MGEAKPHLPSWEVEDNELPGGYEKTFGERSTLIAGLKAAYAGGRLYSPPGIAAHPRL